ncbi:MAG: PadR family transcriptional regulator [Paludibacter sp.]|jgi:PadR family transcriptional regulator PadR|nr:PadR family transcriptional regulator [Paludibacter sp.]
MNAENIKSQMRKGYLEYCILLILKEKPSYASDIITELKDAKLIVVEGTLYPLLTRLKNAELLDYRWEESTQGPPRKYYEMTSNGQLFLEELEKAWEEINLVIHRLKSNKIESI